MSICAKGVLSYAHAHVTLQVTGSICRNNWMYQSSQIYF